MTDAAIRTSTHPPEWHAARATGVGGSDAAAVVGLSPWKSPLEVYYDKIGESENVETQDMRRGTLLEPVVRQMYYDETGCTVEVPAAMIRHPVHEFAVANLDGVVMPGKVWEGKTARNRNGWGEPGTSEIPVVYLCQVQHCMMVALMQHADVSVLFGDFEFATYHIEADKEFQELLLDAEEKFWQCVQRRIPPEPVTASDMLRRWPRNIIKSTVATSDDLHVARVLAAVKGQIGKLETVKGQAETLLKGSIEDAEGLHVGDETICTWKSAKDTTRFDTKTFQAEHPELYKHYLTETTPQRRFLLKGKTRCLQQTNLLLPPIPEALLQVD